MNGDHWHRLEKVVKWTGLSVNAFAREIGLRRAENLYQIKRGNHGISRELAETITQKYPGLSKGWLLTGEGDMFIDRSAECNGIPYYNADITKVVASPDSFQPQHHIHIPFIGEAGFAANWLSRSMEPDIPAGSVVVCAECPLSEVTPGESYLVVCGTLTAIRNVRRELYSTQLRLVPCNSHEFDQIIVDSGCVEAVYRVKAVIVV